MNMIDRMDFIDDSVAKLNALRDTMMFMKKAEVDEMIPATVLDIFMLTISDVVNNLENLEGEKEDGSND